MDFKIVKTSSSNADFALLVNELDVHLAEMYGNEKDFFIKHNTIAQIKNVIVVYDKDVAIGCGGIKAYANNIMEIKRMYVKPQFRGKGIASGILMALESWAFELGSSSTILETLKIKKSVTDMYMRNGYELVPNYGQYKGVESSVCMSKNLK